MVGVDLQVGIRILIQPYIKTAKVTGSNCIPYNSIMVNNFQKPFPIPDIYSLPMPDTSPVKSGFSVSSCLSSPAAIFSSTPNYSDSCAQIFRAISSDSFQDVDSVSNLDAFNTRLGNRFNLKLYG